MQINFKLKFSKQEDSVLIAIVCLLGIIHSFMYIDTMKGSLFEEYYFIAPPAPARIPRSRANPFAWFYNLKY